MPAFFWISSTVAPMIASIEPYTLISRLLRA